jgi:hypothetical protein
MLSRGDGAEARGKKALKILRRPRGAGRGATAGLSTERGKRPLRRLRVKSPHDPDQAGRLKIPARAGIMEPCNP